MSTNLQPFNGSDYVHDRDAPRLTAQIGRVYEAIKDGRLKSGNTLGRRLISAASIRATFGEIGE